LTSDVAPWTLNFDEASAVLLLVKSITTLAPLKLMR